jgi:hypothetical protein
MLAQCSRQMRISLPLHLRQLTSCALCCLYIMSIQELMNSTSTSTRPHHYALTPLRLSGSNYVQLLGMMTPDNIKHLDLHLGKTVASTVEASMAKIEPKLIKHGLLTTTPPTDILRKATLINTTLIPVYNHVFMVLPVEPKHTETLLMKFFVSMNQASGWSYKTEEAAGCHMKIFCWPRNGRAWHLLSR